MGKIRIFQKGLRLRLEKSERFLWEISMGRRKNNVWRDVVQVWEQVPVNGIVEGRIKVTRNYQFCRFKGIVGK